MRQTPIVIIQTGALLNEQQVNEVFSAGKTNWYRAIVQILENYRVDRQTTAASFMSENNPLGLAGCQGAIDVINTILIDLDTRRQKAEKG